MSNATDASNGAGSTDELIEFLSLRMFPEKLTISAQSDVVAGARKAELDAYLVGVAEYEDELRALSPDALMQLIEDEQQRDAEAEQEEAERLESERFFNKPTARAYYRSWVERNYWTLDEATALILGKDPKVVNWDSIDPLVHKSPFARRYEELRRQFLRARFDGMLYEPLVPADFLRYAKSVGFALPVELDRLLRSDDEEQERRKRQVMDSIKLAELKKAIELAAEPAPEPEPEPEPEPIEEPEDDEDTAEAADDVAVDADAESADITEPQDGQGEAEPAAADEAPMADEPATDDDSDDAQADDVSAAPEDDSDLTQPETAEDDGNPADDADNDASMADDEPAVAAADAADTENPAVEDEPDENAETSDIAEPAADDDDAFAAADDTAEAIDETPQDEPNEDAGTETPSETDAPQMNGVAVAFADPDPDNEAPAEAAGPEEWYFPDVEPEIDYPADRQALMNIFVAMAVGRYGHEPGEMRDSTIADIVRDHRNVGLPCDEDAIRSLLQEASGEDSSDPA